MVKFFDATDSTRATLPAVFNKVKYNENFNKIGYSSNAALGQNFKYGKTTGDNRKYRQMQDSEARTAKFGTMKFGSDPIKYADEAGPGAILATSYNYDDNGILQSITDPFGKDYSFQTLEKGSRTLYPNNTYTDRTYDEWGRLEAITHKRKNPADGSTTTLQSFTYQYDNNGNITKITEANGEYTDYSYQKDWFPMDSGTAENLNGIWKPASGNFFVVGDNGTILTYTDNQWTSMTSGTAENLNAIHGYEYHGNDVFAVGDNGTILNYDGSTWSSMTSGTNENLLDVFCLSSSIVYAVGENGIILRYDGSSWSSEASGTTEHLRTFWKDGTAHVAGNNGTILQNWGQGWYSMQSGTTENLRKFRKNQYDNLRVVGDNGTILELDDSTWTSVENEASWDLPDIWGETDFPLYKYAIVGKPGPVICYDGTEWTQTIGSAAMNLNAVWGISFADLCAVGDNGTILHKPATPETGTINRLLCEHRKTEAGKTIYRIEYLFDNTQAKNGNIHKVIYDGNSVTEFQYNEMNELTGITHPNSSTETLTYDNNGNLTQTTRNGETTSYQWDCFDRLLKVTLPNGEIVEFDYDEDGMLVKQESEGIERKFIQHNRFATRELVKNSNGTWETTANHVIHNQMLSSYIHSNSIEAGNKTNTIFYHTDHLGSVRLITDQNGNIVSSSSTDAYGNPLPQADSSGNKGAKMLSEFNFVGAHGIRYVGKVRLHNMRARWYNLLINRFYSIDVLKIGLNYYLYADNNPVHKIDPSGEKVIQKNIPYLQVNSDIMKSLFEHYLANNYVLKGTKKDEEGKTIKIPFGAEINRELITSCDFMVKFTKMAIDRLIEIVTCPSIRNLLDILLNIFLYKRLWDKIRWGFIMYKSQPHHLGYFINCFGYGFKEKYSDRKDQRDSSNQVFHFLSYVLLSYNHHQMPTDIAVVLHEVKWHPKKEYPGRTPQDELLGYYGSELGSKYRKFDKKFGGEGFYKKYKKDKILSKLREIPNDFNKVCDPKQKK